MRTSDDDTDFAATFSSYLTRIKKYSSDSDSDSISSRSSSRSSSSSLSSGDIDVMLSPDLKSMFRNWFHQLREADAYLHSSPSFISAIVPDITPTHGNVSSLPHPAMLDVSKHAPPFMHSEIFEYMKKTELTHWLKYAACDIRGRRVIVHILHCAAESGGTQRVDDRISLKRLKMYRSYVYKIYAWFHFIRPYASDQAQTAKQPSDRSGECSKEINIYLYFTPFKKRLPSTSKETIGPAHANTGFTYPCSINPGPGGKASTEIIIFRHEEWFKVLMHETFHNLELDFNTVSGTSMRDIFPAIRHNILLSESYVESWARILNVAFYVFYDIYGGNGTVSQYNSAVERCLSLERTFSLFQAFKVLDYMNK